MDYNQLKQLGYLYHPFIAYADQRCFVNQVAEQRKVLESSLDFIRNSTQKNLAVYSFPAGTGRTTLAKLVTHSILPGVDYTVNHSAFINGIGMGSSRLFLMRLLEALELPGSRANEKRLETLRGWLKTQNGLVVVFDGLPEYTDDISDLLAWARKTDMRFKVVLFESAHFDINTQLGKLSEHLGLYQTINAPTELEIATVLMGRERRAHTGDSGLIPREQFEKLAQEGYPSLRKAIRIAYQFLEDFATRCPLVALKEFK